MLDIPCGDFNWMQHTDLSTVQYYGADIVKELIERVAAQFASSQKTFLHLDLLTSDLPKVDLVFCRDCLQHLSFDDADTAILNLQRSGSLYLLATTFVNRPNRNIRTGDWRPHDLQNAPFNFPPPLTLFNENCQESYPNFSDKSLGLWRIADL
jgi:hypothetical protein